MNEHENDLPTATLLEQWDNAQLGFLAPPPGCFPDSATDFTMSARQSPDGLLLLSFAPVRSQQENT